MNIPIKFKCPYCGFKNELYVEFEEVYNIRIFYCDDRDGGCGEPCVVEVRLLPKVAVSKVNWEKNEKI